MKYLLFISYNNGLMHNAVCENLSILYESILQLIEEENLKLELEKIPSVSELEKHFQNEEDFYKQFSNGDWLHLQELSERNYIAEPRKEFVL